MLALDGLGVIIEVVRNLMHGAAMSHVNGGRHYRSRDFPLLVAHGTFDILTLTDMHTEFESLSARER